MGRTRLEYRNAQANIPMKNIHLGWAIIMAPHPIPPHPTPANKNNQDARNKQIGAPEKNRDWSGHPSLNFHTMPFGDSSRHETSLSHINIIFKNNRHGMSTVSLPGRARLTQVFVCSNNGFSSCCYFAAFQNGSCFDLLLSGSKTLSQET